MTLPWERQVAALPPVALHELDAQAALQTRVDRKYVVDPRTWAQVLSASSPAGALEIDGARSFRYSSLYFDTPELESYRAAAHRRRSRYKVRTREYLDAGTAAIEVKLRSGQGQTVKHRAWLDPAGLSPGPLVGDALAFVSAFPEVAGSAARLRPTLRTTYARSTLLTADGRVTVDRAVTGSSVSGGSVGFGDAVIVETKSARRAGAVDRALWAHGVRPSRVSKYCTTLAALEPDLPAHRWARTLRRHLVPAVRP